MSPAHLQDEMLQSALRTLRLEREGLCALEMELGKEGGTGELAMHFKKSVVTLSHLAGRVMVTGMGKSGHIGRKIAATLASTGTPASFVHPGEASHGDLGMIQSQDAILALSWSGETNELGDIVTYARRFSITLIAMTANAQSTLAKAADIPLILPASEEACPNGLAPTTSSTLQLVMGDALAVALLEERGFTAQDFRLFHPGGKLGARLTYVRDLMHQHESMPLVSHAASMSEAILEMSAKGFGCVGVVDAHGNLCGIITDGDLRRHMHASLLQDGVEGVMTRKPLTILPHALAAEALSLLETSKRNVLFVVQEGRPIGVLHVHDLLRWGVV